MFYIYFAISHYTARLPLHSSATKKLNFFLFAAKQGYYCLSDQQCTLGCIDRYGGVYRTGLCIEFDNNSHRCSCLHYKEVCTKKFIREEPPRQNTVDKCSLNGDCKRFCSSNAFPTCKLNKNNRTECVCKYYVSRCKYIRTGEEIYLDAGAPAEIGGKYFI